MAFGLNILNNSANLLVDSQYCHLQKKYEGTSTATGTAVTVTFPGAVTAPILFVRPTTLNKYVGVTGVAGTEFYAVCDGAFDWVVYDATSQQPSNMNYGRGINMYDASGGVIFSTNNLPPSIILYQTLVAAPPPSNRAGFSMPRTVNFSGQSDDGGLPFVSASTLSAALVEQVQTNIAPVSAIVVKYTSTTTAVFDLFAFANAGVIGGPGSVFLLGCYPRELMLIGKR